ncbi:uncharacterized protein LOC113372342 [Ctenocephalides felis]|uniref:Mucin-like protein 2 n=1 Tax=Ctenocephalides felis TaxID=7515 RepID=Q8N0M5_CTEFE|nr:uncharacterized protein LOC113372342 [Ctenocephalides felis]AAM21358.1 mucin-like protein 2 [Ctenocephalides felis]
MKLLLVLLATFSCTLSLESQELIPVETNSSSVRIWQQPFICPRVGLFRDPLDPTCKRYYKCKLGLNGALQSGHFLCPWNLYISEFYQRCVGPTYSECLITPLPPPIVPTTTTTTTTPAPPPLFSCVQEGMFIDPYDSTCKGYYKCALKAGGGFSVARYNCPGSTYFSSTYQQCVVASLSECLRNPPAPWQPPTPPPIYNCVQSGSFADPADKTCKVYFECVRLSGGNFNVGRFTCAGQTYFSALYQQCVQAPLSECLATAAPPPPPPGPGPSQPFACVRTGLFLDYTDNSCKWYYECTLNAQGVFDVARYACAAELYFNSVLQQCVPAYQSDCLGASVTSSPSIPSLPSLPSFPTLPTSSPTAGFPFGRKSLDMQTKTGTKCTKGEVSKDDLNSTCT